MGSKRGIEVDQIVDTAERIADESGIDQVTLAGVASTLGIKSPSLYNHIDGLDHLHRLLTKRAARRLGAVLRAAANEDAGAVAIVSLARAYRSFATAHPGLYAASQRAVRVEDDADTAAEMAAVVSVVADPLVDMGVEPDAVVDSVRTIRALLHGFIVLEQGGGFGLPDDVDASFEAALGLLLAGIAARVV